MSQKKRGTHPAKEGSTNAIRIARLVLINTRVHSIMSIARQDANHCFVCGPNNPIGLRLTFSLDGDECVSEFTPDAVHCGYEGVTHGGIIFSTLDDVMANWLYLRGHKAVTGRCDLRYKVALPTGVPVHLRSWCMKQRRNVATMAAEMRRQDNGDLVAECEANFMILSD